MPGQSNATECLVKRKPIDLQRLQRLDGSSISKPLEVMRGQVVLSSQKRPWRGLAVWLQRGPAQELYLPRMAQHTVLIRMAAEPTRLVQVREGQTCERKWLPGEAVFVPAGQASFWRNDAGSHSLHINLDPSWITRMQGKNTHQPNLKSCFGKQDQVLYSLGSTLLHALHSPSAMDARFADGIASALAVHLLENYSQQTEAPQGGLTRQQFSLIEDYIDEHLASPLPLEQLAGLVGLSPYHFSRCFKASSGLPPHRFIIDRRLERARDLVYAGKMSMLEIALETGFASAAHFTKAFTRHWGAAPSRLRRID